MVSQELLKAIPETDASFADLKGALERVKQVADFINESRRDSESYSMVIGIEKQLILEPKVCCTVFSVCRCIAVSFSFSVIREGWCC